LTSFVRNRLVDEVYLPLVGDNLAKQVGVAGEQKRTDLMGLLLLVSPPGYGKTTLMEYVANRLGLTFMKINGPTIGHQVTSLDPTEAPNASAREEIQKLNLALEMGDNVMIYVDDIQHCNAEFLQKFISLCDAQRSIEGVYRGRSRRYDLRGRKVVVVMAGNPYTESGQKFRIPDMLTNRADTYNLGDMTGAHRPAFELSYLENALTSNAVLGPLASRSRDDVHAIIAMAKDQMTDGVELEGNYSSQQINDFMSVIAKLLRIRDVVLQVNEQYIASAAQADEYRTEPSFKMQGSYRDMNKMAEGVAPIMNDEELEHAIAAHYENQAQTLTADAEANLLKFYDLQEQMSDEQTERWEAIKKTFQRNLLLGGAGDDRLAQVIAQLSTFNDGIGKIHEVLAAATADQPTPSEDELSGTNVAQHVDALTQRLTAIQQTLTDGVGQLVELGRAESPAQNVNVMYRIPRPFLNIVKTQFALMQSWVEPIVEIAENSNANTTKLRAALEKVLTQYSSMVNSLEQAKDATELEE